MRRWTRWLSRLAGVALTLAAAGAAAQTLTLDEGAVRWPLGASLAVAHDPGGALSAAQVAEGALDAAFQPSPGPQPHLGFSDGAWWLRFELANPAARPVDLALTVRFPYLDRVRLYLETEAGPLAPVERGARAALSPDARAAHVPLFAFTVAPQAKVTGLLRLQSASLLLAPVTLAREGAAWRDVMRDQMAFGAALGVMLAVSVYVLSVWRALPEPAFPAFVAFALASAAYVATSSGLAKFWLWPGATLDSGAVYFASQGLLYAATAWFFQRFLRTARCDPRCHRALQALAALGLASCLAPILPGAISAPLFALTAGGGGLLLLAVSLLLWRRGIAGAGVTTLGWGLAQAVSLFLLLRVYDLAPYTPLNHYLAAIALVVAALMFAVALTGRVRREQARLHALERWRDGQSEFFASMSHDLRTPLNAVIGFADVMKLKGIAGLGATEFESMLGHIRRSGAHMLHLVNRILEHARLDAGQYQLQRQLCDLGALIRDSAAMLEGLAGEAQVRLTVDAAPAHINGDPHALKQVILNLVSNAIKFTPAGGAVTVTLAVDHDGAALRVADTGIGIAPADIARVLSRYGQAGDDAQRRKGTGLGLPMAKGLVELHGGSLTLHSRPGAGTVVTVRLPTLAPAARAEAA